MGQNIYMLPTDMNLKIRSGTVGYINKILVSDEKFSLGKNVEVNTPAMITTQIAANSNDVLGHRTQPHGTQAPTITHGVPRAHRAHKSQEPKTITHNDEKIALVLALASGFAIWNMFQ